MVLKAVESSHRREWSHWIEDENGVTVAAVVEDKTAPGRSNTLAANFAASPDLLRELTDFHAHTIDQGWHECDGIPGGCPAAAAIAKASATAEAAR